MKKTTEIEAISQVVQKYIRGVQKIDFDLIRQSWHPDGHRWILDPENQQPLKMLSTSHETVIISVKNIDMTNKPEFTATIQKVEYEGSAAMAKIAWHQVESDKIGEINYILLIKTEQGWIIVSKNAHRY
jgi:hypothetical protein